MTSRTALRIGDPAGHTLRAQLRVACQGRPTATDGHTDKDRNGKDEQTESPLRQGVAHYQGSNDWLRTKGKLKHEHQTRMQPRRKWQGTDTWPSPGLHDRHGTQKAGDQKPPHHDAAPCTGMSRHLGHLGGRCLPGLLMAARSRHLEKLPKRVTDVIKSAVELRFHDALLLFDASDLPLESVEFGFECVEAASIWIEGGRSSDRGR